MYTIQFLIRVFHYFSADAICHNRMKAPYRSPPCYWLQPLSGPNHIRPIQNNVKHYLKNNYNFRKLLIWLILLILMKSVCIPKPKWVLSPKIISCVNVEKMRTFMYFFAFDCFLSWNMLNINTQCRSWTCRFPARAHLRFLSLMDSRMEYWYRVLANESKFKKLFEKHQLNVFFN